MYLSLGADIREEMFDSDLGSARSAPEVSVCCSVGILASAGICIAASNLVSVKLEIN